MRDLISRQAAIDVAKQHWYKPDIAKALEELPSAQPELCEDAVSRQRLLSDLKKLVAAWKKYPVMAEEIKGVETAIAYVELIPSVKPNSKELSETHKALDTISRQAAKEAVRMVVKDLPTRTEINILINDLPSAQPERKTGKWIDGKRMKLDGTFYWFRQCDQCGYERNDCDTEKDSNFCPDCGADMMEEQDG